MIGRAAYITSLMKWVDKPQIKVITGIRRSGKSSILLMLRDGLLAMRKSESQITYLNFESFATEHLKAGKALYEHLKAIFTPGQRHYLLLDEVQEVTDWEKVVNSLKVDFDVDIYLTGSNAHLLSSELATHLAGRYIELPIFTLSFDEFLQFKKTYQPNHSQEPAAAFVEYLRKGGFPVIHTLDYDEEAAYKVIRDIYASVILRDTVQRHSIRDIELLERVIRFAFDNIGSTFSGKNVADYFKSQFRKIDVNTIYNYLHALEGAFVLYRVPRFDLKGKEILKTQEKFFVGDLSLVYAMMGYRDRMISGMLENLVFLELKRRGYTVYIGKLGSREIDFIAEKSGEKMYIQVAYKLESPETVAREFDPLLAVHDNYPKYVLTMDDFWKDNMEGIRHYHIRDFLLASFY